MIDQLDISSLPEKQAASLRHEHGDRRDHADRRGHKGAQRKCLVTGELRDKTELIRFVVGPDGLVVPDIQMKLPGRGVWVSCERAALAQAITSGAFARGFKSAVSVPDDLMEMCVFLLRRRIMSLLTMAVKSGEILMGFDQVKAAAQSQYLAWRIEAADGSPAGRGKIRVLTKAVSRELEKPITPVLGCFTASELGKVTRREQLVHGALKPGRFAKALGLAVMRYSGFAPVIAQDWPDKAHEAMVE